jgi:uncharacterized protein (TIGR03437 family)
VAGSFDETGHLPSDTAGVRVMINGYPAPLLYAGPNQINAIVPYGLDGRTEARITVSAGGRTSDTYVGSISYFGPAIFSVPTPDGPPDRPAAVMINADGTLNGPKNPARSGSVVTVYATGTGAIAPAGEDGKRAELPLKYSALPVQIRFGSSQTGEVLYAGAAPFLVEGTTQINVRIPKFSGASSSASRSASLTIGMGANPVQWFGSVLFYYAD